MQRTSPLQRALVTNSTATAFASIIRTRTEPVGAGIIDLVPGGRGLVAEYLFVSFFGAGADNATFDVRLWGWDRIGSHPTDTLWVPCPLASFTCTLSAGVGVAGTAVIETDRIVDTLVVHTVAPQAFIPNVTAAPAAEYFGTIIVSSPANEFMAWAKVPLMACEKLQFDFDMTGATNGNALYRFVREE